MADVTGDLKELWGPTPTEDPPLNCCYGPKFMAQKNI